KQRYRGDSGGRQLRYHLRRQPAGEWNRHRGQIAGSDPAGAAAIAGIEVGASSYQQSVISYQPTAECGHFAVESGRLPCGRRRVGVSKPVESIGPMVGKLLIADS